MTITFEPPVIAGTPLDEDVEALGREPSHELRNERDPALAGRGLLRHPDPHAAKMLFPGADAEAAVATPAR